MFALSAAQLVLILGCPFPWKPAELFFLVGGHSHFFCCMKWDCWNPGLPRASLACFRQWSSGMLILAVSPACLSKFLHFFLSWAHLFKNHCHSTLSELGSPWCIWNSGWHLSIPDLGMCKPAARARTASVPWLRFISCLVSIALKSHFSTWSSCW